MRIETIRLEGYSSFADSGELELSSGFNIFVGENSSGKSAILSSLDATLDDNRHRSALLFDPSRLPAPSQTVTISYSGAEISASFLRRDLEIAFPLRDLDDPKAALASFLGQDVIRSHIQRAPGGKFTVQDKPSHGMFSSPSNFFTTMARSDGAIVSRGRGVGASDGLVAAIKGVWEDQVFIFSAQRFNLGRAAFGNPARLSSDASNLAAILNKMQGERPNVFSELTDHLREIFSTVNYISVVPAENNYLEIRVWPTSDRTDPNLSFPLDQSGTGVSQALAILTVALTMSAAVIVIDEISSFLHPSAAKGLVRILRTYYPRHQYIVSSHSTDILGAAAPSSVYLVKKSGFDSSCLRLDLSNLDALREISAKVGVSMSDVFAADRIIWVEGATEEACFPFLYNRYNGPLPNDITIASVVATGDFGKSNRKLTLEIYRKLSRSAQPLVKSVTFGFDREGMTSADAEDFYKASSGRVLFLPRRNLESFLIDSRSILTLIKAHVMDEAETVTLEAIVSWISAHGGDRKYLSAAHWKGDPTNIEWLQELDGARFLADLVGEISGHRLSYSKTTHGLQLMQIMDASSPALLAPLVAYVDKLVALASIDGGLAA